MVVSSIHDSFMSRVRTWESFVESSPPSTSRSSLRARFPFPLGPSSSVVLLLELTEKLRLATLDVGEPGTFSLVLFTLITSDGRLRSEDPPFAIGEGWFDPIFDRPFAQFKR